MSSSGIGVAVSGVIELGYTQYEVVATLLPIRLHDVEDAAAFLVGKAIPFVSNIEPTVIVGRQSSFSLHPYPYQLHEDHVFILCYRFVSKSVKIEREITETQFADVVVTVTSGPNIGFQFEVGLPLRRERTNKRNVGGPDSRVRFVEVEIINTR